MVRQWRRARIPHASWEIYTGLTGKCYLRDQTPEYVTLVTASCQWVVRETRGLSSDSVLHLTMIMEVLLRSPFMHVSDTT